MTGDTSNITSTRGQRRSMHALTLISRNSVSMAFKMLASLSRGWLVDSAYDPADELRALRSDGFSIDLTPEEVEQLHSEVVFSAGAPLAGQLMLRKLKPVELSAKAINTWLEHHADVGCIFAEDLQVDAVRLTAEGLEKRYGFVTGGLLLEAAIDKVAGMSMVSIWPGWPDSDFDPNTLVLFREQQLLEQVEATCVDLGIVRCSNWQEAVLSWKSEPGRATCYVGSVQLV